MPAFVPEDAPPGPRPNGFFEQPQMMARFEKGVKAIDNKAWREDMKRWDEQIKPDSIRRNQKLQLVDPEALSTDALIEHLIACHENVTEIVLSPPYVHHCVIDSGSGLLSRQMPANGTGLSSG